MVEELSRNNKNYITVITQEANRYSSNIVHDDTYSRIQNIKNIKIIRHKKILLFGNYENKYLNYILFFLRVLISNKGRDYDLIWTTSSRFFTIFLTYLFNLRKNKRIYIDVRDLFIFNIREIYFKKFYLIWIPYLLSFLEKRIYKISIINVISPGFNKYFNDLGFEFTSYYHGIPSLFFDHYENSKTKSKLWENKNNTITYVGNIGEGQGLHVLLPKFAKLNPNLNIVIIGDGKYKENILLKIKEQNLNNIFYVKPTKPINLLEYYEKTDFLLLNLNDYSVFDKVIPSKIFEYSTFAKPILCGINGVSKEFISNNIENTFFINLTMQMNCQKLSIRSKIINYQLIDKSLY